MDDNEMLLAPGSFELYNRFWYPFEFQWNSRPYLIPAHSIKRVPSVGMAKAIITKSRYKIDPMGMDLFGVVLRGDPTFEQPLVEADLTTPDLILGDTMKFPDPQNLEVIRFPADRLPGPRGRVDSQVQILPGKGA